MINRGLMQEVITDILYSSAKHLLTARARRTTAARFDDLCARFVRGSTASRGWRGGHAYRANAWPAACAKRGRFRQATTFDRVAFIDERLDFSVIDPG
jgi:hypothetical protein